MKLYGIKDCKAGCFLTVFQSQNDLTAKRDFVVSSKKSAWAEDLELYAVGELDENTGVVSVPEGSPHFLISGVADNG